MSTSTGRQKFHIALTADFFVEGKPKYDSIDFGLLDEHDHIHYSQFTEQQNRITSEQIGEAAAVMVLSPSVTRETVSRSENLLAIGRFGVGYDLVDVEACTKADVLVFTTAGAVDRSMAEAALTWMLSLSHHVRAKDQLVRTGEWDKRVGYMGKELRERTLGVVGLGGIGRALVSLLAGFGMNKPLAFDPYIESQIADDMGVKLVGLQDLMTSADFVVICCPLNDETRGLIGTEEIGWMKPDAYLINAARGGIVDENSLFDALKNHSIAGAGIDVFEGEPLQSPHRFGKLDNVLLAPHSIGWTEELFRDIWRSLCKGMIDLSVRERPNGVVNPEVLQSAAFRTKWDRLSGGA